MSMTPVRSPSPSIHEHKNSQLASLNASPISSAVSIPSGAADTPISGVAISELSSPIVAAAAATTSLPFPSLPFPSLPSAMQIVDDAISPFEEGIVFKLNNMYLEDIYDKVDAGVLNEFSKAALQKLNGGVINSFSSVQMQKLNAHVYNNLSIASFRKLRGDFLRTLSVPTIRDLNAQVLNNLSERALLCVTPVMMNNLSDNTINNLDIRFFASLPQSIFQNLDQRVLDNIRVDKAALMQARTIHKNCEYDYFGESIKPTAEQLNALSAATIKGLYEEAINKLPKETISELNEYVLMNLSEVTVWGLRAETIDNLSDATIGKLSAQFINNLSPTTLAQLDPRVIAKLDMGARMGLTCGTLDSLSKECLEEVITTPEFLVHALVDEDFQKLLSSVNP